MTVNHFHLFTFVGTVCVFCVCVSLVGKWMGVCDVNTLNLLQHTNLVLSEVIGLNRPAPIKQNCANRHIIHHPSFPSPHLLLIYKEDSERCVLMCCASIECVECWRKDVLRKCVDVCCASTVLMLPVPVRVTKEMAC